MEDLNFTQQLYQNSRTSLNNRDVLTFWQQYGVTFITSLRGLYWVCVRKEETERLHGPCILYILWCLMARLALSKTRKVQQLVQKLSIINSFIITKPVTWTSRSQWSRDLKVWDCGRSLAENVGSNPARGMDVCLLSVVCCQVEVSALGWPLVQRSPTECGVSKWV